MRLLTLIFVFGAVGGSEDSGETQEKSKIVIPEDVLTPEQLNEKLWENKELLQKLDANGWEKIRRVRESGVLESGEVLEMEEMKIVEEIVKTLDIQAKLLKEYRHSDAFKKKHKVGKYAKVKEEKTNTQENKDQPKIPDKTEL